MNKAVVRFGVVFIVVFMLLGAFERGLGQDAIGTGQFPSIATRYDFDGDRKSDISIFRPSSGDWWYRRSSDSSAFASRFGLSSDRIAAADYDADGKTDIAVYRDGVWYRLSSLNGTVDVSNFGVATDQPLPADFDGDGKADTTVFRQSNGTWHILQSGSGQYVSFQFGSGGDVPLVGDYDGDGKSDPTIFRPSHGTWYRLNSSDGSTFTQNFGLAGDTPVRGDFDGDGRFDLAVWRPLNGTWYVQRSSDGGFMIRQFGLAGDVPVASDYDGDGSDDLSVFRPTGGVWYRINSSNGTFQSLQFGLGSDLPVPGQGIENAQPTPTPTVTPTPSPTATPTPSPTATPTPTPTPSPSFTCDYYASPTGTSSGSGSSSSPWDLRTALGKTAVVGNGKTLCLKGGTYRGKFSSKLNGAVIRSAPSEWAKIDGFLTTTLASSISASQTSFTVSDGSVLVYPPGSDSGVGVLADSELIAVYGISGNTVTQANRGGATGTSPAVSHSAGTTLYVKGTNLFVEGNGATYRDFEITNSIQFRNRDTSCENIRGLGIHNIGNGNKFINLVVHDVENGILTSNSSANTEIYGTLVYNNGLYRTVNGVTEGYAHGLYLENGSGYSRLYEDIIFNNFNLNTQMFGVTAAYVGGDVIGSVWANSGSPMGKFYANQRHTNLLIGTDTQEIPFISIRESHFVNPLNTSGSGIKLGYGSGAANGVISNNYFYGGGGRLLEVIDTPSLSVLGNKFYGTNPSLRYTLVWQNSQYNWDNNTYYGGFDRYIYNVNDNNGGENRKFDVWKAETGFDANSTETSTPMPTTVVVRPNSYQTGRGNVLVYANGATSVNVDLSQLGLVNGQEYEIRNAFDYFGPVVATGSFSVSNSIINISLIGPAKSVATPIGHGYTPPSTCPQFCAMVVVPR